MILTFDELADKRRLAAVAIAFGAPAGALLAAGMMSLASAPTARADFTDLVNDVQATITVADNDFTFAAAAFGSGNVYEGLASDVAGVDGYLFGAPTDVLASTTAILTGEADPGHIYDFVSTPTTFAATLTDVEGDFSSAETDFSAAASDFAGGSAALGVQNFLDGVVTDLVTAPEVALLGTTDSLLGF